MCIQYLTRLSVSTRCVSDISPAGTQLGGRGGGGCGAGVEGLNEALAIFTGGMHGRWDEMAPPDTEIGWR